MEISFCHYRNHRGDYGHIVIGMQVPLNGKSEWQAFVDSLVYPYCNKSKIRVYKLLLESSD